jgi:nitroreductase / dihydropteridine reductase
MHQNAVAENGVQEKTQHWLEQLDWRYATKAYDAQNHITPEQWKVIEQSIRLAPSAYGLQPYKVVIVTDPELRQKLRAAAFNQPQVTDSSYLVVFAAKQAVTEADIDAFMKLIADTRGVPVENLNGMRGAMIGDLVQGPRAQRITEWTARQCYIALGFLLAAAAIQHVDATPMEGLDTEAFTQILELDKQGYKAVVMAAVGHRAQNDWLAPLKKVRKPEEELFIRK